MISLVIRTGFVDFCFQTRPPYRGRVRYRHRLPRSVNLYVGEWQQIKR